MKNFSEYLTGTYDGDDLDERISENYSFLRPPEWFEHSTDGRGIKQYQAVLVREGQKYRLLANTRPCGDGTHTVVVGAQGSDLTGVLNVLLQFVNPLSLTKKSLATDQQKKNLTVRNSLMP